MRDSEYNMPDFNMVWFGLISLVLHVMMYNKTSPPLQTNTTLFIVSIDSELSPDSSGTSKATIQRMSMFQAQCIPSKIPFDGSGNTKTS